MPPPQAASLHRSWPPPQGSRECSKPSRQPRQRVKHPSGVPRPTGMPWHRTRSPGRFRRYRDRQGCTCGNGWHLPKTSPCRRCDRSRRRETTSAPPAGMAADGQCAATQADRRRSARDSSPRSASRRARWRRPARLQQRQGCRAGGTPRQPVQGKQRKEKTAAIPRQTRGVAVGKWRDLA